MTTQQPKQQAIFPDLPRTSKVLDANGNMNNDLQNYLQNLSDALQQIFTPEGFAMPMQPTSNIAQLTGTQSIANIIYDSTTNEFKGNINGTWKTFTLT